MAEAIQRSWTVFSLVGAYFDLALASFLLAIATVAFFAGKFLSFFRMTLPCFCGGGGDICLQNLIVDCPTALISAVSADSRSRFPFDSIWPYQNRSSPNPNRLESTESEKKLRRSDIRDRGSENFSRVSREIEEINSVDRVRGGKLGEDYARRLEINLEEERAAYAALCVDLEKERSAAGTAADQAMAMILRLQEEKASVEMEMRQYQRMAEEKSAYDAGEMDILKEIIVRREMENHFLQTELEDYQSLLLTNQLSTFFRKDDLFDSLAVDHLNLEDSDSSVDEFSREFQEKGMVEIQNQKSSSGVMNTSGKDCENGRRIDPTGNPFEAIYDVHMVEDKPTLGEGSSAKDSQLPQIGKSYANINQTTDSSRLGGSIGVGFGGSQEISRWSQSPSPFMDSWFERGSAIDLRMGSSSIVENEKTKLESEVELLRQSLKMVRQERGEKLEFLVEYKDEALQLQLLEEIAIKLREIKKIQDPRRASKTFSRKRLQSV